MPGRNVQTAKYERSSPRGRRSGDAQASGAEGSVSLLEKAMDALQANQVVHEAREEEPHERAERNESTPAPRIT